MNNDPNKTNNNNSRATTPAVLGSGPTYMIRVARFARFARNACDSRMSVCFLTRATCKNVRQNLIPRATAYPPPCPQSACARVSE